MRMEDLRYFIRVAEAGSMSQVAQSHYITQQGLSRIISSLENELDIKLLNRGKTLSLTPAGEAILPDAKYIEEAYLRILETSSSLSNRWSEARGNIYTIYATPVLCATILPEIIVQLTKKFPGMYFNVLEKLPLTITDETSRLNEPNPRSVAILSIADFLEQKSKMMNSGSLNFECMITDELAVSVAAESPLASREKITVDQLRSLPFVLHNSESLMAKQLLGDSYQLNTIAHTTNHQLCREMIAKGLVVGLTSELIQYVYKNDAIVSVPLDRKVQIKYGCVRWETEDPFVEEIVAIIRNTFRTIAASTQ